MLWRRGIIDALKTLSVLSPTSSFSFSEPYLNGSRFGETIRFLFLFWIYLTFVIFVLDLLSLVYSLCAWVSRVFLSIKSYYLSKKKNEVRHVFATHWRNIQLPQVKKYTLIQIPMLKGLLILHCSLETYNVIIKPLATMNFRLKYNNVCIWGIWPQIAIYQSEKRWKYWENKFEQLKWWVEFTLCKTDLAQ